MYLNTHRKWYIIKDFGSSEGGMDCLKALTVKQRLKLLKDEDLKETLYALSHLLSLISGPPWVALSVD